MGESYLERFNALILRELNEALRLNYSAEAARITLTAVKTDSSLKKAKVFYSVVGTAEHKALAKQQLQTWSKSLQQALARTKLLKAIPHFQFICDDSLEKAHQIINLLEDL